MTPMGSLWVLMRAPEDSGRPVGRRARGRAPQRSPTRLSERAMASICGFVSVRESVFETQYAPRGVRQATSARRLPSVNSSYVRPLMRVVDDGLSRIGGDFQFVPCIP